MTIQLTIHVAKWLFNRLYTSTNDYTIDYVHIKWLYNWLCTQSNDYTIDYIHSQMNIQLTIHVAKWLYNWLYT